MCSQAIIIMPERGLLIQLSGERERELFGSEEQSFFDGVAKI